MKNDNLIDSKNKTKSTEPFMMDSELLPLLEKAKNGCFESQVILADAFSHGNGAKQDENLASEYEQMIFENTQDVDIKLGVLWNRAMKEKNARNYKVMIENFNKVIDFMQENIPMQEWDFTLFAMMEEFAILNVE